MSSRPPTSSCTGRPRSAATVKEWDAEILHQMPDQKVAWKNITGNAHNAGVGQLPAH